MPLRSRTGTAKQYTVLPPDHDPKVLGVFTRNRSFYRTFFSLLIVIALQQLAALTVNLVDNLMLGRYTELALSGATLVNQLQFILSRVCSGIGLGIVVLASQYWGQQRIEPIRRIIALGTQFGLLMGFLFFIVSLLAPTQILSLFTNDQAVIVEGTKYLKVMCWTYLIFAASNSLMYAMQSVETAFVGTVMSISTICINLCLNYILIYGHLGAPELGIRGAAIATLISRTVELIIILSYVLLADRKLHLKLRDLLQFSKLYLGDYVRVAAPVAACGFLWGIAQAAQTVILGHIDATVIAANSIASVIFQLFVCFGFACSNTASIVIGKTIGAGELQLVRSYTKTIQGIFLCFGVVSCSLMLLCRGWIVSFYAISPETRDLTLQFILVLAITGVGSCYEFPVESGIIGGGGSTGYAPLMDNLFMWLFTIPLSALSAYVFHFPPVVTFCFLKADQIIKCLPNGIVCNRFHWVKVLTRD